MNSKQNPDVNEKREREKKKKKKGTEIIILEGDLGKLGSWDNLVLHSNLGSIGCRVESFIRFFCQLNKMIRLFSTFPGTDVPTGIVVGNIVCTYSLYLFAELMKLITSSAVNRQELP